MKRITFEEAQKYISCEDDFTSKGIDNAYYFTLTPSPDGDGWEDVIYYTKRPTAMYTNRGGEFDAVMAPCNCPATLATNLSYITIEPSIRLAPFKSAFYLFAGPTISINVSNLI